MAFRRLVTFQFLGQALLDDLVRGIKDRSVVDDLIVTQIQLANFRAKYTGRNWNIGQQGIANLLHLDHLHLYVSITLGGVLSRIIRSWKLLVAIYSDRNCGHEV